MPKAHPPDTKMQGGTNKSRGKRKIAFTLAEVLITLGIIGIVAAMTLPSLTAKWQQRAIDSQFKRAYSNLYKAMTMMKAKLGEIPQCYYPEKNPNGGNDRSQVSGCVEFYDELMQQLKVLKTCKGNAYNDGCIPKYQGVDTIKKYEDTSSISGCGGYSQSRILNRNYAYVLNDGTIIFLYSALPGWGSVFAIDVNGKKGPNRWGYDLFSFSWNERNHTVFLKAGNCSIIEDGGRTSNELLLGIKKD